MILLLHNRYRFPGGEERAVEDLRWLIAEHLGEEAEVLERDSAVLTKGRAAVGLLRGGLQPEDVAHAVKRTKARVVHAHNVSPAFGHRGLAAAREAGARVVLHLHNYRLVCAQGLCFTRGEDCTRCHGRRTTPGIRLNCRGSRAESLAYATGIALHQRTLAEQVDAFVVPSEFALQRLRALGAPLGDRAHVVGSVQRRIAAVSTAAGGRFALAAGRLSPEKGFADAIDAARVAGLPLVLAGDGPQAEELRDRAQGVDVRFTGALPPEDLAALRREAAVALVPSRYAEILPLAALEAMAAGLPVVASDAGGLAEIVPPDARHPAGDATALAERLRARWADQRAGERALATIAERFSPSAVAGALRAIYDG